MEVVEGRAWRGGVARHRAASRWEVLSRDGVGGHLVDGLMRGVDGMHCVRPGGVCDGVSQWHASEDPPNQE